MMVTTETSKPCTVDVVLFDFGGVIAEEGFLKGLLSIGEKNGLDPEAFAKTCSDLIHATGYAVGRVEEPVYWQAVREATGIKSDDQSLKEEILKHFVLRSWMMDLVKTLKDSGMLLGILSDQTNWLDELDSKYGLFHRFDFVLNSYYQGKSKKDPAAFDRALEAVGVEAQRVLFVDDRPENVERARERGIQTILYKDRATFMEQLGRYCPGV
jgi:HAD superfamily hydrolase (TIGR01509 family)